MVILNKLDVVVVVVFIFSQRHAWVSRIASHATAPNIGIIIFVKYNLVESQITVPN